MKAALVLCVALLVGACAAPQPSLQSAAPKAPAVIAVGTLASVGTCEYDTAAAFTAVITARRVAAARLNAGRLTVDQALRVQVTADAARAEIERACPAPGATVKPDPDRMRRVDALIAQMRSTLEARP